MAADSEPLPTRRICATELHPGDETPGFPRESSRGGGCSSPPAKRVIPLWASITRLTAHGGRLHRPGDRGPRDADVTGRATASERHRTAASRGETNGRTAPTQAVAWHDRFQHSDVVVPAMPLRRRRPSRFAGPHYSREAKPAGRRRGTRWAVALVSTGVRSHCCRPPFGNTARGPDFRLG
jgi:hypothetical protein